MKKIGIFFGSTTGTTEEIAEKIATRLNVPTTDIHNVATTAPSKVADYDMILLGASTWGDGDLQDDMADFIDGLQALNLKGKQIAFFGCGDENMSDTFCNGVGEMYLRMQPTQAEFIGAFNTDGYEYTHSDANVDGLIVGLTIDQTNHPELTDKRIDKWAELIRAEQD